MPLYPPKCCEPGSVPQLLLLPLFSPLGSQLSLPRSLGVHHPISRFYTFLNHFPSFLLGTGEWIILLNLLCFLYTNFLFDKKVVIIMHAYDPRVLKEIHSFLESY
jgi:hypothetical protein